LTIDYCVTDLEKLLRHLKIRRAIHIGFSMGVQVVIEYALRHPKVTAGLVLIAGTAGKVLDTFHNNSVFKSVFPLVYYFMLNNKAEISRFIKQLVPSKFAYFVASLTEIDGRLIERDVFTRYLDHLASMDMEAFARLLASAADHDAWDRIPKISQPTLLICGTRDTFTPIQVSERMYELIPGAQLLRVRGATHSLLAEQGDLINLRIEKFLSDKGFLK
jgi:pimeloyl-ACP methyl ester carboxylesterase